MYPLKILNTRFCDCDFNKVYRYLQLNILDFKKKNFKGKFHLLIGIYNCGLYTGDRLTYVLLVFDFVDILKIVTFRIFNF